MTDNYDNLFDVGEIPTHQSTSFETPQSKPPSGPRPSPQKPPPHNEQVEYTNQHSKSKTSALPLMIICAVVIFFVVYTPSKSKLPPTSVPTAEGQSPDTVKPTINFSKPNSQKEDIEITAIASETESLEWVNYSLQTRVNEGNVLKYILMADSPKLGQFEMELTHAEYIELDSAGIAPLIVTSTIMKGDDTTYYTKLKLHPQWRNLLEGNVN